MIRFILGVIVGIVIATVGLNGLASMADALVENFKTVIKENAK
jgi:hypothetical protein